MPLLYNILLTALPPSPLVSHSNISPVAPPCIAAGCGYHAQHWQQGDEYVLFINLYNYLKPPTALPYFKSSNSITDRALAAVAATIALFTAVVSSITVGAGGDEMK